MVSVNAIAHGDKEERTIHAVFCAQMTMEQPEDYGAEQQILGSIN